VDLWQPLLQLVGLAQLLLVQQPDCESEFKARLLARGWQAQWLVQFVRVHQLVQFLEQLLGEPLLVLWQVDWVVQLLVQLLQVDHIGWVVLGADQGLDTDGEATFDCWKEVLDDESREPSKGNRLNEIFIG
jgi:hypothetical protein